MAKGSSPAKAPARSGASGMAVWLMRGGRPAAAPRATRMIGQGREVAARFTLTGVGTETTIRLARRGAEAGVVGAALIAVQELAEDLGGSPDPPLQRG